MSFKVFDDADSGDEILYFIRRGRAYIYLRDAQTKRFIKRLHAMEIRMFEVVNYSEEQARKGNPLYMDAVTSTYLFPSEVGDVENYEEYLHYKAVDKTNEYFGSFVADQLLDRSGIEYGSELRAEFQGKTEKAPKMWFWSLVWKHRKEGKTKSEEEIETW